MSGMDYFEGAPSGGYQTAGWFLLGMPFLLGFGFLVSAAIAFVARESSAFTPTFFNWLHDNETPFLEPIRLFENDRLTC